MQYWVVQFNRWTIYTEAHHVAWMRAPVLYPCWLWSTCCCSKATNTSWSKSTEQIKDHWRDGLRSLYSPISMSSCWTGERAPSTNWPARVKNNVADYWCFEDPVILVQTRYILHCWILEWCWSLLKGGFLGNRLFKLKTPRSLTVQYCAKQIFLYLHYTLD